MIFLYCLCVCMCAQSCLTVTPWTVACQAPLSMEFFRHEYWSRLPFPTPGNLPNPGMESESFASPALTSGFLTLDPPERSHARLAEPALEALFVLVFTKLGTEGRRGSCPGEAHIKDRVRLAWNDLNFLMASGEEVLNIHNFSRKAPRSVWAKIVNSFRWKENPHPPQKTHHTMQIGNQPQNLFFLRSAKPGENHPPHNSLNWDS